LAFLVVGGCDRLADILARLADALRD